MNHKYYTEKLTYKVGEIVLYMREKHEIVHIREDRLMNLKDGWFLFFGCNLNMFYKINISGTII